MKKKALSLFLAVIMVVAVIPFSAINIFAETGEVTLSTTDTTATYSDLNDAIAAVEDGATIKILGTYTIPSNFAWTDHNKNVTITGDGTGVIDVQCGTLNIHDGVTFTNLTLNKNGGNIYANGNPLKISEDVNMPKKVSIIGGGGTGGVVIDGDTNLEIYAGSFTYIFGSGFECTVKGDTHVTVGGNANSQYSVGSSWEPGIYGGGYKNGTGDIVEGNTYVTIKGNAKANHVLGGAAIAGSQVKGDTHVTVESGEIYRVLGGGRGVDANNTYVTVTGGNVRYIHGGSANANVTGDTHVYVGGTTNQVAGASNGACDPANHDAQNFRIFGGGFSENSSHKNSVAGNTYVTVDGEIKANGVYGGGDAYSTGIGGTAHVNVKGGTFMTVYGGGYLSPANNTVVSMTGGYTEQIFGGSQSQAITGNTILRVLGGTVSRRIYGGSYNECSSTGSWSSSYGVAGTSAVVLGSQANITLDYDDNDRSIYAGSRYKDNTVDNNEILAFLDAAAYTAHSGKQGAQDFAMKLLTSSKKVADVVHTLKHTVSGNVITESCTVSGCNHSQTATLTLDPKVSLNYADGDAITPAVIEYSDGWLGEELGEITYENNKKVGIATASATLARTGGTAVLSFEIVRNVIEVYNTKQGDGTVAFKDLIGTTLKEYTTYKLMESIDLGGLKQSTSRITLANHVIFDGQGNSITGFELTGGKESALFTAHNASGAITATIQNVTFGSDTAKIKYTHDGTTYNGYIGFALISQTGSDDTLTLSGLTAYVEGACKGGAWQDYAVFLGRNNGKVTIDNCHAYGSLTGHGYFGAFIGQNASAQAIEIKNSVNNASITVNGSRYYAGFIGWNNNASSNVTISDCINNGAITGETYSGGFVSHSNGTLNILNCVNNGDVSGKNTGKIGGIVGYIAGGTLVIDGCVNFGNVTDSSAGFCGGIVGVIDAKLTDGSEIRNCTNRGDVNNVTTVTAAQCGGIVAKVSGGVQITNCANNGMVKAINMAAGIVAASSTSAGSLTVTGCTNNGAVTTTTNTNWWYGAGGIVGYTDSIEVTIQNCANTGAITGKAYAGGAISGFHQNANSKNLTISGFVNSGTVNGTIVGGVIGNIQSVTEGTISNSVNSGAITGSTSASGFVGNQAAGTVQISDSSNSGTINGTTNSGGFIGLLFGGSSNISSSVNSGNITGGANVGGFIGQSNSTATISSSINSMTITGTTSVGGFIGNQTAGPVNISTSANFGAVNGSFTGGFIGKNDSGNITIDVCRNMAAITAAGSGSHSGGAIGKLLATTGTIAITDFLNAGNITSASSAGGGIGIAEASNANLTINITRLVNLGNITGQWRGCAATGYVSNAKLNINNCISTGTVKKTNGSVSYAFTDVNGTNCTATVTGSGNYAINGNTSGKTGFTEALGKSVAEILAILNNSANGYKFGPYTVNDAGDGIVLSTPEFKGYQLGKVNEETNEFKIRFLATIYDVELVDPNEYGCLGFEITINGELGYKSTQYVYNSITAKTDGTSKTYTASELGGKYIYAAIETLDATQDYTITVRTLAGKTTNVADLYYGSVYTITIPASVAANN